jgi:hypothetical protein
MGSGGAACRSVHNGKVSRVAAEEFIPDSADAFMIGP